MTVQIVTPSERELEACAAAVAGHRLFEPYGLTAQGLAPALQDALEAGDLVRCARLATTPVGVAWVVPCGAFARSPYLRLLAVAPDATGTGIGSRLLQAVEAWSFARDENLFLLVNRENEAARGFYARRGFAAVGRLHDYVRPGLDEIVMRKRRPATTA